MRTQWLAFCFKVVVAEQILGILPGRRKKMQLKKHQYFIIRVSICYKSIYTRFMRQRKELFEVGVKLQISLPDWICSRVIFQLHIHYHYHIKFREHKQLLKLHFGNTDVIPSTTRNNS